GCDCVVSALGTPQFDPSKRLYQMFHRPLRSELQNSHTFPAASSNPDGSVSSDAAGGAGREAPRPNLGAGVERVTLTETGDAAPAVGEVNWIFPAADDATPGNT